MFSFVEFVGDNGKTLFGFLERIPHRLFQNRALRFSRNATNNMFRYIYMNRYMNIYMYIISFVCFVLLRLLRF